MKKMMKTGTPLYLAVQYGFSEIAEMLMDKGANINTETGRGEIYPTYTEPLELWTWNHKTSWTYSYTQSPTLLLLDDDYTPLYRAAYDNKKELALALLEKGADVNKKTDNNYTALHMASWHGDKEIAEKLISKGAEVNIESNIDWTPLHMAAMGGHEEIVTLLLNRGALVNAKNR